MAAVTTNETNGIAATEDTDMKATKETESKSIESIDTKTTNGAEEKPAESEVSSEIQKKIVHQIEYYFGDYNLPRDKFLKEEVKKDEGWIDLETMTKFKRLAMLSTNLDVLITAIKTSLSGLMEVNEETKKIRRCPAKPLPLFNDEIKLETVKRTVYCKGFPKDGSTTLDVMLEYFKTYGPYETVHMRYFFDKADSKQGFKGSVLVVFPTEEKAKEFMDLGEVKYKGTILIRKWHEKYIAEKKAEVEERKAKKEAKQKERALEVENPKFQKVPEGTFLHMSGLAPEISREDVKAVISKMTEDLAFIDYNKGNGEGFLRFSKADSNKEILEKLGEKFTVKDSEISLRIVDGDEEKEQLEKANLAITRALANPKRKKFGGHRGGRGNKRRRN